MNYLNGVVAKNSHVHVFIFVNVCVINIMFFGPVSGFIKLILSYTCVGPILSWGTGVILGLVVICCFAHVVGI